MSKLLTLLVFSCLLTVVSGCLFDKDDKGQIVVVEPEFKIDLFEELGEPRVLKFKLKTVENQDCTNYGLQNSVISTGSQISLSITDLTTPTNCDPGEAPATATAKVGTLANTSFLLKINLKNAIENKGRLLVRDNSFRVEMETNNGFELVHSELKRIPIGSIWGYVAYNDPNAVGDAPANFMADLDALTQPAYLENGYFGYFVYKGGQDLTPEILPSFLSWKTFLHNGTGKINDIKSLLETYRTAPSGNAMELKVFTWEGEIL